MVNPVTHPRCITHRSLSARASSALRVRLGTPTVHVAVGPHDVAERGRLDAEVARIAAAHRDDKARPVCDRRLVRQPVALSQARV
eukprot:6349851-Prymnesium_polylepis.2